MLSGLISTAVALSGFVNLFIWAFVVLYCIAKLRIPMYHPFFLYLVYHFLGFVARPLNIAGNGFSFLWLRIGYAPNIVDLVLITVIANVAMISALLGFLLSVRVRSGEIPKLSYCELDVKTTPLFLASLAALALAGVYATTISLQGVGLDSVLAYQTALDDNAGQRLVGVSGYQTALAEFLPIICIFLYMSPRLRRISYIFIVCYILLRLYAGGQRLSFVVVIVALLLYHLTRVGRRYPSAGMITLILVFVLFFEVIGNDRYAFRRIAMGESGISEILASYLVDRGGNLGTSDIVEYDVASASASAITDHHDYSFGTQYLRILIWPIPRQIWEDKPVFTSNVDLNKYGDFRYLTTSLYADAYMTLSFASLVLIMAIFGWICSYIYRIAERTESATSYLFFWIVLIYLKTILRDGGVTFLYFWIFSMIPVAILVYTGRVQLWRAHQM